MPAQPRAKSEEQSAQRPLAAGNVTLDNLGQLATPAAIGTARSSCVPWMGRPIMHWDGPLFNASRLEAKNAPLMPEHVRQLGRQGFVIVDGVLGDAVRDRVRSDLQAMHSSGKL